MGSENGLAVVDGEVVSSSQMAIIASKSSASDLMRNATDVAGVCGAIVKSTAQAIQGRKYVRVEGWQAIAVAYGCTASVRDVERVATGFRAVGEVRRMSDGAVLATAEGFVGDDEPVWSGGIDASGKEHRARPEYAKRAMCQTRAISRACRSAFAFVVVMIDASLSTTPAEEVPDGGFNDASKAMPPPAGVDSLRQQLGAPPSPAPAVPRAAPPAGAPDANLSVRYGRAKGKHLDELSLDELRWYESRAVQSVDDPTKARFRAENEEELGVLRAWIAFRS